MATNNIRKLLTAWLGPFQVLQDAMQQVLVGRWVDTAVGTQLDVIGKLVGQARQGFEDEDYRRQIRARIRVNRSTGKVSDVLTVSDLIVYDDAATYVIDEMGRATLMLRVEGATITFAVLKILRNFLRDTVSAGVRIIVQGNAAAATAAFNFSDGPGKGFASLPRLNLAPLTTNVDTVVKHRDTRHADSMPTLALVANGTGAGSLTNTGDAWTFHFESGVTTVAQFETAVNASDYLVVAIADGVGTMAAGDVLAATAFTATEGGRLAAALD